MKTEFFSQAQSNGWLDITLFPLLFPGIHLGSSWGEPRWMPRGSQVGIKAEFISIERINLGAEFFI